MTNLVTAVVAFCAGAGGVFFGHYAYDLAKLKRRQIRRSRKLATELGTVKREQ